MCSDKMEVDMKAKEKLKRVRWNRLYARVLENSIKEYYAYMQQFKEINSFLSEYGFPERTEVLDVLVDLSEKSAEELRGCYTENKEIEDRIASLPNETHRDLLRLYYLDERRLTLEQIADIIGLSVSRTMHVHLNALKAFDAEE